MPISMMRHACNMCLTVYDTYQEALSCEAGICRTLPYAIGSSVFFENEDDMGDRYSYTTMSGIVLYKCWSASRDEQGQLRHTELLVVRNDHWSREQIVLLARNEFGVEGLFSPAEHKYALGYAENLRNLHSQRRQGI